MAVSLKTKLLWFDRGAAAFEKYAPGVVEQAKGPGAAPHYVCPICVEGFVREDVANGTLTEEHVPPEALGGRGLILTCKTCNNTAGTELDAHAHRQQTVDRARHGQPTTCPLKVQARIGDVVLNARYTFDGTAGSLSIPREINSPQALAALAQTGVIPKGTSITVEHSGDRYSLLGATSVHVDKVRARGERIDTASPPSLGFFDLGFRGRDGTRQGGGEFDLPHPGAGGSNLPPLVLGRKKRSTLKWEIAAWVAAAAGIFARQGLQLPSLLWSIGNLSLGTAIASIVVALALFPTMMRLLNRRRRRLGLEHIATPFAFGFFLDLAFVAATKLPASIS